MKQEPKKWKWGEGEGKEGNASVSFLSSPPPPSSFIGAILDSRSSFFAPKPHGNACYAGYLFGSTATWTHFLNFLLFWVFYFTVAGIGDYDNALATSGAFGNSNGIAGQTASLPFAAGPCYEDPDKLAFYENPLAAPKVPQRNDSLEEHPGGPTDSSLYDNPNSPMDGSGACTVC